VRELQHVLRVRPAFLLGVRVLLGPACARRRPLDALEEVAPAAPPSAGERALEAGPGAPRGPRGRYNGPEPGRRRRARSRGPTGPPPSAARDGAPRGRRLGAGGVLSRRCPQPAKVQAHRARRGPASWRGRTRRTASGRRRRDGHPTRHAASLRLPDAPPPLIGAPTPRRLARPSVIDDGGDSSCHWISCFALRSLW
jgi:hypothetical protein